MSNEMVYLFKPKEDITAWELAIIFRYLSGQYVGGDIIITPAQWDDVYHGVKRHFTLKEENNAPGQ